MIMRNTAIVLSGLLWLACSDSPVNEAEPEAQRSQAETEIQIAVIRHLIGEGGDDLSGGDPQHNVICASVDPGINPEGDPSPAVLAAFEGREPPVRPASECGSKVWEELITYTVHVPTGRGATDYSLSAIGNLESGQVSVEVWYYANGMSAGTWTCWVGLEQDEWKVESCSGAAYS